MQLCATQAMVLTRHIASLLLACAVLHGAAEDEEEGRSSLLLYKKMDPMDGFAVGEPINVTIAVFNKGGCSALLGRAL